MRVKSGGGAPKSRLLSGSRIKMLSSLGVHPPRVFFPQETQVKHLVLTWFGVVGFRLAFSLLCVAT